MQPDYLLHNRVKFCIKKPIYDSPLTMQGVRLLKRLL